MRVCWQRALFQRNTRVVQHQQQHLLLLVLLVVALGSATLSNAETSPYAVCSPSTASGTSDGPQYLFATQEQRDQASAVATAFSVMFRSKTDKIKEIMQGQSAMGYIQASVPEILPMLFLCLVTFSLLIVYIMFCACKGYCPPCKRYKRDTEEMPYKDEELSRPALLIIVFTALAITSCAFGIVVSQRVKDFSANVSCSFVQFLEQFSSGSQTSQQGGNKWIGLRGAAEPLSDLSKHVHYSANFMVQHFVGTTAWVNRDVNDITQDNERIYDYYKNVLGQIPNTYDPAQLPQTPVSSNFIDNMLGPSTQTNTITGILKTVIDGTAGTLSQILTNTMSQANDYIQGANSFTSTIQQSQFKIGMAAYNFEKLADEVSEYGTKQLAPLNRLAVQILSIYFGVAMFAVVTSFAGAIFTQYNDQQRSCRYILHAGWCLTSVVACLGFLLSSFFLIAFMADTDTCRWFRNFTTDKSDFNDPSYSFARPEVTSALSACLFDSGDLSKVFGYADAFQSVPTAQAAVDAAIAATTDTSAQYVDFSAYDAFTQVCEDTVTRVRDGVMPDNAYAEAYLNRLNLWASSTVAGSYQAQVACSEYKDVWVWDRATQCAQGVYQYDPAGDATQNVNQATCIAVEDLNAVQIALRYDASATSCDNGASLVTSLVNSQSALYRYDSARRSVLGAVLREVRGVKQGLSAYAGDAVALRDDHLSPVSANMTGVANNMALFKEAFECQHVRADLESVHDALCVASYVPLFQINVALIVATLALVCTGAFTACLGVRYERNPQPPDEIDKRRVVDLAAGLKAEALAASRKKNLSTSFQSRQGEHRPLKPLETSIVVMK